MGWSCRKDAGDTMRAMSDACSAQTQSSNTYKGRDGSMYFWETSRVEHSDGAITGTVYKMLPNDRAKRVGSLRIEPCGLISRAPAALVQMVEHYRGRNFSKLGHTRCVECYPHLAAV